MEASVKEGGSERWRYERWSKGKREKEEEDENEKENEEEKEDEDEDENRRSRRTHGNAGMLQNTKKTWTNRKKKDELKVKIENPN